MKTIRPQKGFTLLEVMVVVMIIAVISGISFLSLSQATERRYSSQADNLLAWLQQVSELAILEGVTYGLVRDERTLNALVFYRGRWHQVSSPEPFLLYDDARITLSEETSFSLNAVSSTEVLLPDIVMLPNGFMEPIIDINLSYINQLSSFVYHWDAEQSILALEIH